MSAFFSHCRKCIVFHFYIPLAQIWQYYFSTLFCMYCVFLSRETFEKGSHCTDKTDQCYFFQQRIKLLPVDYYYIVKCMSFFSHKSKKKLAHIMQGYRFLIWAMTIYFQGDAALISALCTLISHWKFSAFHWQLHKAFPHSTSCKGKRDNM